MIPTQSEEKEIKQMKLYLGTVALSLLGRRCSLRSVETDALVLSFQLFY